MWITKVSIRQPVFATMVMLALVVLGLFSYQRLPVEKMPDVAESTVGVRFNYPGASPEAVESDVIKPLERAFNTVDGVQSITSFMREGTGFVRMGLRLGADPNVVAQDIREQIDSVRSGFPREVSNPEIWRGGDGEADNREAIVELSVYSDTRSLGELSSLVEQVIVERLQNVSGVGNIDPYGLAERQIQIVLKPPQMQSYGVSVDEVVNAIKDANQDMPTGNVVSDASEQMVRVEGRIKDPKAFGRIVVATRGSAAIYLNQGGVPIHLDQVADVVDGEAEKTSISRLNGRPAVEIDVYKVQKANIVAVGDGVKLALDELKKNLPSDVHIVTLDSDADDSKASLQQVKRTILEGGLLTIAIVFLFLHSWRSTIITGLTLPISVIATFIAIQAFGFTLNFMTLMALSLCIGLLIDDAIVVRENIVRHLAMGKSHRAAAEEGTNEIGLAVMATTFAILAVFVPVAFMRGAIGRLYFQFGATVSVAVLVSLFVSFTLDPMLSSVWADPVQNRFKLLPWLGRMMERIEQGVEGLHRVYGRALAWALHDGRYRVYLPIFGIVHAFRQRDWSQLGTLSHRGIVLWIAAASLGGSLALLPRVGTEYAPDTDDGVAYLSIYTPIGTTLEYNDQKARQVEVALREIPEIRDISVQVGGGNISNHSWFRMNLTDRKTTHRRSKDEVEAAIRARVSRIAGVTTRVGWGTVTISILGPDSGELTRLSQDLMAKMARVRGIADLRSSETGSVPTLTIRVKSEVASDLGLSNSRIGNALQTLVTGDQISHWAAPDGQDYDVVVRLPKSDRRIADDLGALYLSAERLNSDGSPLLVPLSQVADIVKTESPQFIRRLNLQRVVSIYARANGRPSGDVGSDVQKITENYKLPPGYHFDVAGDQKDMDESFQSAIAALGLAIIFMYLVLASQFGSFLQPIAIMMSLPLSVIGVLLMLLATGTTLNVFSTIGFIMLMGLVTKNAILLVDFTNQGIREGKPLHQAILDAGQVRLRPILMTTFAMLFGMLPMAIGSGDGGETEAPMGRAVIGGVMTSTLLTLVVVPVLYTYLHAIGERVKARLLRRVETEEAEYRAAKENTGR